MGDISHVYVGMLAGVATSILWTATSLCFTAASRRIGPVTVNASRIALAILLLAVTHRVLNGTWMPQTESKQIVLLALSGIIGLSIGDQALFVAFVDIGPRLAMLIMTTSPLFAAAFGWIALGEHLHGIAWFGMGLTIAGVAWVVSERSDSRCDRPAGHRVRGVLLALVGSACQAGGLLLSKQGMGHGWLAEQDRLDPQAATLVRMVFAGLGIIPLMFMRLRRRPGETVVLQCAAHVRRGYMYAACGAVVGPYLGVWMSLVAGDRAPIGIAQTLCSLSPIMLLPVVALTGQERVTIRATVGAIIAVAGASLLFIRPAVGD